tara:strand:+ start:334 stop:966 length:633 start_codon:yes stop_codon:yes gene_type:complete
MIYEQAYIYIIYDIDDKTLTYYGSTCDLNHRMSRHKDTINNRCTSKKIIERGNYEYSIIETHENIDEYDLHERERWYIKNHVCVNKQIPHRTSAEYRQDNKEKIAEYYQDNKEKIAEYYQDNKEKLAEYSQKYYQDNKEKIAENNQKYYQDNKEKIVENNQKYYQDNKEKIAQKMKEKFNCECGGKFTKINKTHHKKTQKHLKWVQSCKI